MTEHSYYTLMLANWFDIYEWKYNVQTDTFFWENNVITKHAKCEIIVIPNSRKHYCCLYTYVFDLVKSNFKLSFKYFNTEKFSLKMILFYQLNLIWSCDTAVTDLLSDVFFFKYDINLCVITLIWWVNITFVSNIEKIIWSKRW